MQKLWTSSRIHVLLWRLSTFVHTPLIKNFTLLFCLDKTHHGDILKFISHICDAVWVWTQVPILFGCCLQHETDPTRGYLMLLYLKGEGAKNYTPIKDFSFQIWTSVGHKKQDASTLSSLFFVLLPLVYLVQHQRRHWCKNVVGRQPPQSNTTRVRYF